MQITADNVGDIIQMIPQGSLIQIESVTERYVHYRQENGARYASFNHELEGQIIFDQDRIQAFYDNYALGSALQKAELSAIRKLLDAHGTHEQHRDANAVLKSVKGMQKNLSQRIQFHKEQEKQHKSLDVIISKASADAQSQQPSAELHSHGIDR